jgi:hypothetical protein
MIENPMVVKRSQAARSAEKHRMVKRTNIPIEEESPGIQVAHKELKRTSKSRTRSIQSPYYLNNLYEKEEEEVPRSRPTMRKIPDTALVNVKSRGYKGPTPFREGPSIAPPPVRGGNEGTGSINARSRRNTASAPSSFSRTAPTVPRGGTQIGALSRFNEESRPYEDFTENNEGIYEEGGMVPSQRSSRSSLYGSRSRSRLESMFGSAKSSRSPQSITSEYL